VNAEARHSCLYEGRVAHRRRAPVEHSFGYPVAMLYLDLDELPRALARHPLWSATRPAPGRIRRRDLLGDPAVPLGEAVRNEVARQAGARPPGPIRLLTTPRTFGHAFNPVSFYYCFAADGVAVEAVVAEVTNTPWGERHAYVMDPSGGGSEKVFHVSPFMGMDHRYRWELTTPAQALAISIASDRNGERVFHAALRLERAPLDRRALTRVLVRHPAAGLVTLARIYAQALQLKLKGAPYFPHPGPRTPEASR
jgi:DUF1365 family protein